MSLACNILFFITFFVLYKIENNEQFLHDEKKEINDFLDEKELSELINYTQLNV